MTTITPELRSMLPYEVDLFASLGRFVAQWNNAESRMCDLLASLYPASTGRGALAHRVMIVELGSVGIENALKTLAAHFVPEDIGGHIHHAATYYARLRAYRNYYVHGIIDAHPVSSEPHASVAMIQAKGEMKMVRTMIPKSEIDGITLHAAILAQYVSRIGDCSPHRRDPDGPQTLPDKPSLPDLLSKPRQSYRAYLLPPEPSQE